MKTNYLLLSMAIAAVVTGCQTTAPTIHLAAGSGRLDLVKREVSKGVSVNLNAGNFGTPTISGPAASRDSITFA